MLDDYFQTPSRIRVLRAGPCGAFLEGFSDQLAAAEFSAKCVRCYVLDAIHLGVWLQRRRIPLRDVDDALIDRFVAHFVECRCTGARHAGYRRAPFRVREFLRYLRRIDAVHSPRHRSTPVERLVEAYCEWMHKRRGVLATTLRRQKRHLTEFIAAVGMRPRRYTAASIRAFILTYVREHEPSAHNVTQSVRSFLRYLVAEGRCGAELPAAVLRVPSPRLAALPMYLGPDQIEKMICGCNSNLVGLRDRAMLLLLARLGLRPSDVVRATLDDLDWRRGRIRVFGKSRREAWLPLPQDAGNAILTYLDRRRAATDHHHVFLGIYAPFGPLDARTVTGRVKVAMQRAGIDLPGGGAYVFRHSLAMRLLGEDASLDQIGAVLRHRRVETTAIYAKVDLRALGDIAQPWPMVEVRPC